MIEPSFATTDTGSPPSRVWSMNTGFWKVSGACGASWQMTSVWKLTVAMAAPVPLVRVIVAGPVAGSVVLLR